MTAQQGREQKWHFIYPSRAGLRKDNGGNPGAARSTRKSTNTLRSTNAQLRGMPWVLPSAARPHQEWAGSSAWGAATCPSPPLPPPSLWSLPGSSFCLHHPNKHCSKVLVGYVSKFINGNSWCILFCVWLSLPTLYLRGSFMLTCVALVSLFSFSYNIPLYLYFIIYIFTVNKYFDFFSL